VRTGGATVSLGAPRSRWITGNPDACRGTTQHGALAIARWHIAAAACYSTASSASWPASAESLNRPKGIQIQIIRYHHSDSVIQTGPGIPVFEIGVALHRRIVVADMVTHQRDPPTALPPPSGRDPWIPPAANGAVTLDPNVFTDPGCTVQPSASQPTTTLPPTTLHGRPLARMSRNRQIVTESTQTGPALSRTSKEIFVNVMKEIRKGVTGGCVDAFLCDDFIHAKGVPRIDFPVTLPTSSRGDHDGAVVVPYLGDIHGAGRTVGPGRPGEVAGMAASRPEPARPESPRIGLMGSRVGGTKPPFPRRSKASPEPAAVARISWSAAMTVSAGGRWATHASTTARPWWAGHLRAPAPQREPTSMFGTSTKVIVSQLIHRLPDRHASI
jgi:hypothetical protein